MTTLYLVIDDSSGEGAMLAFVENVEQALAHTRKALVGDAEEEPVLRVVSKDTATDPETRAMLSIWEEIALEFTSEYHPRVIAEELNSLDVLIRAVVRFAQREREKASRTLAQATIETGRHMADTAGEMLQREMEHVIAAERAARADEVRALKEKIAAVYGGLNHATEHGLKSCAQAAADERDAALAIVDAEIARLVGVNGGVEPPKLSVMAWRLTSLRTVRDGIAARGGAK